MSLRERNRLARRNRILDVFVDELSKRDVSDVTVDEIASRADVSRATAFNYFASKRDMLLSIAEREISALRDTASRREAEGCSPLETIEEIMYDLVATSFSAPNAAWQVLRTLLEEPSDACSPVWDLIALIASLLTRAVAAGEILPHLDPAACARAIIGTYLCELFVVAAHPLPSPSSSSPSSSSHASSSHSSSSPVCAPATRAEFNRTARLLIDGWTP